MSSMSRYTAAPAATNTKITLAAAMPVRTAASLGANNCFAPEKVMILVMSNLGLVNAGGQPSCTPVAMVHPTNAPMVPGVAAWMMVQNASTSAGVSTSAPRDAHRSCM